MEKQRRPAENLTRARVGQPHHGLRAGSDPWLGLRHDCPTGITLKDIPALRTWVDSCEQDGWMRTPTAARWRARIETWRRWLEQEKRGMA